MQHTGVGKQQQPKGIHSDIRPSESCDNFYPTFLPLSVVVSLLSLSYKSHTRELTLANRMLRFILFLSFIYLFFFLSGEGLIIYQFIIILRMCSPAFHWLVLYFLHYHSYETHKRLNKINQQKHPMKCCVKECL